MMERPYRAMQGKTVVALLYKAANMDGVSAIDPLHDHYHAKNPASTEPPAAMHMSRVCMTVHEMPMAHIAHEVQAMVDDITALEAQLEKANKSLEARNREVTRLEQRINLMQRPGTITERAHGLARELTELAGQIAREINHK